MKKTYVNYGRVLLASTITALALAACGGGSSSGADIPGPVTQAGVIVPRGMGGTAIVGQEYKGQVEVAPSDITITVTSLSIANNTAGGAQPSIDATGNITWTPNEQDFSGTASLRVTGNLSNGAVVVGNIPMDIRKVHTVLQTALGDAEQTYSDTDGRYLINILKKTSSSIISGEITITETYRKNGDFSWSIETSTGEFDTVILQAPTTQLTSSNDTKTAIVLQAGVAQTYTYSVTKIKAGVGYFSDINEKGSVLGHDGGGNNVYTSRLPENVSYFSASPLKRYYKSLEPMDVFWFGSNCAGIYVTDEMGVAPDCVARAKEKAPIILIHGFSGGDNTILNESTLGGGPETWGQTANILTDQGHPVFEMRWFSYMSFG